MQPNWVEPTVQDAWWNKLAEVTKPVRDIPQRFEYWMRNSNPKSFQFYRDLEKNVLDVPDPSDLTDPTAYIKGLSHAAVVLPGMFKAIKDLNKRDPLIQQSIGLPTVLQNVKKQGGVLTQIQKKLLDKIHNQFKVDFDFDRGAVAVPVQRKQVEEVPFGVHRGDKGVGGRKIIFYSPGHREYISYSTPESTPVEGGHHKVLDTLYFNNPYFLPRESEFVGPNLIQRLAPNQEMAEKLLKGTEEVSKHATYYDAKTKKYFPSTYIPEDSPLLEYLSRSEIERSIKSRSGVTALQEKLGSELARRAGHDGIIAGWLKEIQGKVPYSTEQSLNTLKNNLQYLDPGEFPLRSRRIKEDAERLKLPTEKYAWNFTSEFQKALNKYIKKNPNSELLGPLPEGSDYYYAGLDRLNKFKEKLDIQRESGWKGLDPFREDHPRYLTGNLRNKVEEFRENLRNKYVTHSFQPTQILDIRTQVMRDNLKKYLEGTGKAGPLQNPSYSEGLENFTPKAQANLKNEVFDLLNKGEDPEDILLDMVDKGHTEYDVNVLIDKWQKQKDSDYWKTFNAPVDYDINKAMAAEEKYPEIDKDWLNILAGAPVDSKFKNDFIKLADKGHHGNKLLEYFTAKGYPKNIIEDLVTNWAPYSKSSVEKLGQKFATTENPAISDDDILKMIQEGYNDITKYPTIKDALQDIVNKGTSKYKLQTIMENSDKWKDFIYHLKYVK